MSERRPGLDRELLAALDAGVLDDDRAARVRAAAAADPGATAVLSALAATRADLAALPDPPVPAEFAARWDAALAAEAGEQVIGPAAGEARRRLAPRFRAALAAAALLAAALAGGLLWARPSPEQVDLAAIARAALGVSDAGALADPALRAACLAVVAPPGVQPDAPLLGGRHVELNGRPAVLLVLATGELGRFHVVVVDPGCGPAGGQLLHWQVIGR
jgi:anti-sigma factor RsiW